MTLDDLVAAKKINADQKAQILKKPSLQIQLAQIEEQIKQYTKFEHELNARAQAEKTELEKALTERANKELEEKVAAAKAEAAAQTEQELRDALLLLSQFLRLAAIRRADSEADVNLDENKALEGVLTLAYHGDSRAVEALFNLIRGSEKTTISVNSEPLETTCKSLQLSLSILLMQI